jgi:hypothetical protein
MITIGPGPGRGPPPGRRWTGGEPDDADQILSLRSKFEEEEKSRTGHTQVRVQKMPLARPAERRRQVG